MRPCSLVWIICCAGCFPQTNAFAQDLIWDPAASALVIAGCSSSGSSEVIIKNELDYTVALSGFSVLNGTSDKTACQLSFLQSLKYRIRFSSKRFQFSNDLVHTLGLLYYIDSTGKFQPDENTLTSRLSYDAARFLQFTASSVLASRIFNLREKAVDSDGSEIKRTTSSFLTPLVCNFAGGIGFNFERRLIIDIGLASAKLTYILDPGIFDRTGKDRCFGVARGKRSCLEYGLSLHVVVDRQFGKRIQWNCDLLLFRADASAVDLSLKNLFAYRIGRFLKTSLQTRLFYDEDVNLKLRMENLLSVGFDFHL